MARLRPEQIVWVLDGCHPLIVGAELPQLGEYAIDIQKQLVRAQSADAVLRKSKDLQDE